MRKLMASLGFAAVCVALARLAFAPPFLAERANGATGLLLASWPVHHRHRRGGAQMSRRGARTRFFLWRALGKLI